MKLLVMMHFADANCNSPKYESVLNSKCNLFCFDDNKHRSLKPETGKGKMQDKAHSETCEGV